MSERDEPLKVYKRATAAALRAIAENDEVDVTFGEGAAGLRGTDIHVPLPNLGCRAEELDALVREEGFVTWMAMYGALRGWGNEDAAKVPTLRAYRVTQRTPTKMRLERNPYYHKVDPEGNQLPYIPTSTRSTRSSCWRTRR